MVVPPKKNKPSSRKSKGSLKALPLYLSSKLRIFFTADIVGSTNYKQKHAQRTGSSDKGSDTISAKRKKDLHPMWFAPIADFYSQTQKSLDDEWNDLHKSINKELSQDIGDAPSFWKTIGDEICFSKLVTSDVCLLAALEAWTQTLVKVRKMLKEHDPDLDVKSAGWLAGFPIHNTEIILAANSKSEQSLKDADDDFVYNALLLLERYYENSGAGTEGLTQDFVGPSIDTGFRIAAHATPRKMTISVELAYMCADASLRLKESKTGTRQQARDRIVDVTFGYDGRIPLKGVMGGSHYPILWLDLDTTDGKASQLNDSESKILNNSYKDKTKEFKDFCCNFIDHHSAYLCKPYVLDDKENNVLGDVPPHHADQKQKLLKIADWFIQEKTKLKQEESDLASGSLEKGAALKPSDKIKMN
jgi:hypothetical protein